MKRRALISATAVMLVALMCLVTASYAWFTAGSEAKIETFDVKVSGADAALQLSIDGSNYFSTLSKADFEKYDDQIIAETLDAVSTVDGVNFIEAPAATNYADNVWTGKTADGDEYIAIDFYAKAPTAGTANFNISFAATEGSTLTAEQLGRFQNAVKIGYAQEGKKDFATYDITVDEDDKYQPMILAGAKAVKEEGFFKPASDTPVNSFADARSQTAWQTQTGIQFAKDTAEHFTVVIWLEGMDRNCVGSFDMDSVAISIGFSNWTAA